MRLFGAREDQYQDAHDARALPDASRMTRADFNRMCFSLANRWVESTHDAAACRRRASLRSSRACEWRCFCAR